MNLRRSIFVAASRESAANFQPLRQITDRGNGSQQRSHETLLRIFGRRLAILALLAVATVGCRPDMFYQPKGDPLKSSKFFDDGGVSRPLVSNTIPVGYLRTDEAFFTGMIGTNLVTTMPMPVTRELLQRGQERFEIYCSPCHGRTGQGNGMVVQRGFPPPPSYHIQRLREAPIGHFYNVITHGYGIMYSYAQRVEPADRWAIAAYIRALQLSEHATLPDVPENQRTQLESPK